MSGLADRVRRRDTPLFDFLYRAAKAVRGFQVPVWLPLARALYVERALRVGAWRNFWRLMYYQPLFRSRCEKGGSVYIEGRGMPLVLGRPRIILGDRVRINAQTTLTAHTWSPTATLRIGDDVYIGSRVAISVGSEVTIGRNVLIATDVFIGGYDGHPVDPVARASGQPDDVPPPLTIGDNVWIGAGAFIAKSVTIGRCAIVAARSVVTKDVPEGGIVAGNPARVIRQLENLPASLERLERAAPHSENEDARRPTEEVR